MDIKILEQYLRDNLANDTANFALQARLTNDGNVVLQIQPHSFEGLNFPIIEDEMPEPIQNNKTTPGLHEYLLKNWEKSHTHHTLRVERHSEEEEGIQFYIHPDGIDGDTPTFIISPDDQLRPISDSEDPPDREGE